MTIRWQFRCYGGSAEANEIRAWYDQQSGKVKCQFQSRLKTLAQLELAEWKLPIFRWLRRDAVPHGENSFRRSKSTASPSRIQIRGCGIYAHFLRERAE